MRWFALFNTEFGFKASNMWKQNHRHSFLAKTCKHIPRVVVDNSISEVFSRFQKVTTKDEQIDAVKSLEVLEDDARVGYGNDEIEMLVRWNEFHCNQLAHNEETFQIEKLRCGDAKLIEKSLELLGHELRASARVATALSKNILMTLTKLLSQAFANDSTPEIVRLSLVLLELLSIDFDAMMAMAGNENLMKAIVEMVAQENEFSSAATSVLFSLSSATPGENDALE